MDQATFAHEASPGGAQPKASFRDTDGCLPLATAEFYRLAPKAVCVIECEARNAVLGWVKQARTLGLRSAEIELMHHVIDAER